MNIEPVVSVITPFLNAEKYLRETIESVCAQTFDRWELLLVDDGSTDGSTRIAVDFAAQVPQKVRYFEHPGHRNRGTTATRNLGVRNASGEFIALLDSDDVWIPNKLEEQMAILQAHPEAGMVYGRSLYWHSWTGNSGDIDRDYIPKLGIEPDGLVRPPSLLRLSLESKAPTPCPSDMLLRREIVECVGGFEESFRGLYQLYEDQAFLAKVYLRAPVFVANACWDKYRQHSDSCVSRYEGWRYKAGLYYLTWLEEYLRAEGVQEMELLNALNSKRWRYRHPKLSRMLGRAHNRLKPATNLVKVAARHFHK